MVNDIIFEFANFKVSLNKTIKQLKEYNEIYEGNNEKLKRFLDAHENKDNNAVIYLIDCVLTNSEVWWIDEYVKLAEKYWKATHRKWKENNGDRSTFIVQIIARLRDYFYKNPSRMNDMEWGRNIDTNDLNPIELWEIIEKNCFKDHEMRNNFHNTNEKINYENAKERGRYYKMDIWKD